MGVSQLVTCCLSVPCCLLIIRCNSMASQSSERLLESELQCDRKDHPVVNFNDLRPWVLNFSFPGVYDYSQLAIDLSRKQLVIGARNYLFRLTLDNISLIQAIEWGPEEDTRIACQSKGKTEIECQNYIRVLLINGKNIFACGTNAFSPTCTSRQLGDLGQVLDRMNGVARCPYDPRHNSTAVITSRGELYAATVIDFSGRDPAIYRSLGNRPPLRTAQYNSKWLNEPNFISAYDIGLFIYFFFRENAVEHDCGKTVYSRVGRVCKSDIGGRFLLEDTWTTFMKARLNCSRSGEIPFYYNELQSTFYLPEQDLIYGVFTTNVNSIAASAVCAYNLSAIAQTFNGPFRYQENPRSAWLPATNPIPNFQCGSLQDHGPNANLTERSLQDAQRFFLMNDVVQPVTVDPLVTHDNMRFSKIVVDIVQGRDTLYHVMYIGTEHGTILKTLSSDSKGLRGCYLEELQLLAASKQEPIRSLQILHSDRSLFVGLNGKVLKIPLERCFSYKTETNCLGVRDPYCGWDLRQKRCTTIEDSSNMSLWRQNITECPVRNLTLDGEFGPWSPWQLCEHADKEATGSCMCRSRSCDSPAPRCGGHECVGARIEVANCSRNGGWTVWASWAPCSTTCGIGFQVRQRSCSNPTPRYGGRVCVGQSREERFCNENAACPLPMLWSSWGPWTRCSADCGGGMHSRRRSCENGNNCPGCNVEHRACNVDSCPEVRRNTPWTPWMPVNISQNGARHEQRFRYTCRAPLADPHDLQLGKKRVDSRFCPADGTSACTTDTLVDDLLKFGRQSFHRIDGGWSPWLPWSPCSRECETGFRTRRRSCTNPEPRNGGLPCTGADIQYEDCNQLPCPVKGAWSCWSPWSPCSATCGGGHYQRTRTCTNPVPANGGDICIGLHTEEALCNTQACEGGWSVWSEWSLCTEEDTQFRTRRCETLSLGAMQCVGNSTQFRPCLYNEIPVIQSAIGSDSSCGAFSVYHLIATGVSCFLGATLITLLIYAYCQRCHRQSQESTVIHPTTPNHLNYKGSSQGNKNELYNPMEIKTLNKNNLIPDDRSNYFSSLQQTNVYTTTYYPSTLNKYDYRPESSSGRTYT
ncbi:semaphorin-5B isoform X1 [Hemiscyllium ocellatum]|uniref:semaphorin-5B isoform X1 n=1 Tax=Hemiscyllium ocellatum TaxID=170820 RepID=UPI0029675407|nr:semaphorin-5B isoform X1 [Hemiscyllium ocellatum]XP_060684258.1 semaphorin-5B isoform X1 [Hemiscyllium ocellatum]